MALFGTIGNAPYEYNIIVDPVSSIRRFIFGIPYFNKEIVRLNWSGHGDSMI